MRGHIIFPFLVGIKRLDVEETAAVPGGGYDDDFREPIIVDTGTIVGESSRREMAEVKVRCQVEQVSYKEQRMAAGGDDPKNMKRFVLHFRDLEDAGLVKDDGDAVFRPGDRIVGVYERDGTAVEEYANPPGLFITHAETKSFGLFRQHPKRNLLILHAQERSTGGPQ